MPPPKKPKTGWTRVEEYLSKKDLEELKQRASSDSGINSSEEGNESPSDQFTASPGSSTRDSDEIGFSKYQCHSLNNIHKDGDASEQKDNETDASSAGENEESLENQVNDDDIDVCSVEEDADEKKSLSKQSETSSDSHVGHCFKQSNSDFAPDKNDDKFSSENILKQESQDVDSDALPGERSRKKDQETPTKLRKLECLMMRRQVDSLMDATSSPSKPPFQRKKEAVADVAPVPDFPCNHDNTAINLSTKNEDNSGEKINGSIMDASRTKERIDPKDIDPILEDLQSMKKNINISLYPGLKKSNRLSPMSSLEKMFHSTSLFYSQNGQDPQRPGSSSISRLPFMYQGLSNWHDLCLEKNRIPHLATKPSLFLNSIQNINTAGASRPSTFQCEKALSSINDIKKISQQHHAGLSVCQPKTHTDKRLELTSTEHFENCKNLYSKEGFKHMGFQPVFVHDEKEKPPPLLPISTILSSSKTPMKTYREPIDPGYEDSSCGDPLNFSEKKGNAQNTKDPDKHHTSAQQLSNIYNSSTVTSSSSTEYSPGQNAHHNILPPHHPVPTSSPSPAGHRRSTAGREGVSSLLPPALPHPLGLPSPVNHSAANDAVKSHYSRFNSSKLPSPNLKRLEELSPLNHCPMPLEVSSSSTSPSIIDDKRKKTVEDRVQGRRCQICNDCASGFHYGVWSCEGCKAFFKRSLQGPVDYVCPSTNSCTIDKQRRKSCQSCRLRKCLEMGMSRGNCRKERKTSGPRGMKRKSESSDNELYGPENKVKCHETSFNLLTESKDMIQLVDPSHSSCSSTNNSNLKNLSITTAAESTTTTTSNHTMSPSPSGVPYTPPTPMVTHSVPPNTPGVMSSPSAASPGYNSARASPCTPQISTSQPPIHPLAEHLMRIDPPVRTLGFDCTKPDSESHLAMSLMKLADLELVDVINWAKSIPGYTELELKDRIHLLEVCWMEVLLVGVLWHSLQNSDVESLYFATDLVMDRSRLEIANLSSLGSGILSCLREFSNLSVNQEEFVLFRSLVLLNSDLTKATSSEKISSLRSKILDALHYTVIERYHGSSSKILGLLTLLPHTRQLSIQWVSHMCSCSASQYLSMFALLKEMIDAHVSNSGQQTVSKRGGSPKLSPTANSGPGGGPFECVHPTTDVNTGLPIPVPNLNVVSSNMYRHGYDNSRDCENTHGLG